MNASRSCSGPRCHAAERGVFTFERDPVIFAGVLERARDLGQIRNARDVYRVMGPLAARQAVENAWILVLDPMGYLIAEDWIARGTRDRVDVDIVDSLHVGIASGSKYVILTHNHPAGQSDPSDADIALWRRMQRACVAVNLLCVDHVILGWEEVYSCEENTKWRM